MKSIEDRLKDFVEYIDKAIEAEYDKFPLSLEDAIRKNSYCLALQRECRRIKIRTLVTLASCRVLT